MIIVLTGTKVFVFKSLGNKYITFGVGYPSKIVEFCLHFLPPTTPSGIAGD
ncbi:hypothetical protein HYV12_01870 [Candidatus Dojkabacteria bacterium]|nr:hypothetical protein [Candidatus Dojkabacteria bacterium]